MNHFDVLEISEDTEQIIKDLKKLKNKFYRMSKKKEGEIDYDISAISDFTDTIEGIVDDLKIIMEDVEICKNQNRRAKSE